MEFVFLSDLTKAHL